MTTLNKKLVGQTVISLVEKYFYYHDELMSCGLTSFGLFFKKEHYYDVAKSTFDEYFVYKIEINKRTVGLGAYFSSELERFEKEALEKFKNTGNHYDKQYPEYIKTVRILAHENWDLNVKYRENLIAALEQEREKEFKRKELVFYKKYEGSLRKQYKKLATDVFSNNLSSIGFSLNKKKGGKDYIICEKRVNDNYSLFLSLSLKYLKSNESDLSTKNHQFFFQFGIAHNNESLNLVVNNNPQIAVWHMSHFFPISLFPYWDVYGSFDTYKEFEFLILAHLDMYKILQADFELLLSNVIK